MDNNVGAFLAKRAHLSPEVEAVYEYATGRRFSFAELNGRANRFAHCALELGIEKGDRVAILMMNSIEFVEAFLGLGKIGAVVVPLNWRLVPDELTYIINNDFVSI